MYQLFRFSNFLHYFKVGDYSLKIHKSAYYLFSVPIGLFYCCPLGPIMSEIINDPAIKLQILV